MRPAPPDRSPREPECHDQAPGGRQPAPPRPPPLCSASLRARCRHRHPPAVPSARSAAAALPPATLPWGSALYSAEEAPPLAPPRAGRSSPLPPAARSSNACGGSARAVAVSRYRRTAALPVPVAVGRRGRCCDWGDARGGRPPALSSLRPAGRCCPRAPFPSAVLAAAGRAWGLLCHTGRRSAPRPWAAGTAR